MTSRPNSTTQPFRFGVRAGSASTANELVDGARRAEDLGYSSLLYTDHYPGPGAAMSAANHPAQPLAAIPAVTAAAMSTSTLRIGFRVLCVDYHNPVVLAKEMATIDVLSGGRLEVGLGAGWIESEYRAMGVTFDRPGVRIRRLGEVIDLMHACFAGGAVGVNGTAGVHADGFEALPAPVQRPRPPIAIGGGGRKVLSLAGSKADIVAFNFNNGSGRLDSAGPRSSTADLTDERVRWVRQAAADRADQPTLEIGIAALNVTASRLAGAERFSDFFGLGPSDIIDHPHALVGDVDAICDDLQKRRERYGFSYITVRDQAIAEFAPVVARLAGT
ncbi:TIGR03621 family F420-dependent LLM class oxidoreductase [Nocardia sp. alder85J]|uniref:TIGR03621 family F420-dependent LLM class oxidoreductase n=1 Tax=Nocardia sp. alder85J TaxID=2862949 RepID=UPI001CD2780F|nr:TIGR03621 family F420-dependent LLM class oxidoreductase [Nocardia sp. alder85J]MCX4095643.1 TIGR03621 family F420-dependent LLM class oxidoreductase [Nocardia sp. alder85J]